MNSKDRNNKSLRENSVKVVANIVKSSAFSIAKMSLGAPAAAKTAGPNKDPVNFIIKPPYRSEKPKNSSNPVSFLMEPNEGNESSYVVHEGKSVIDGMASAYIRKVHQKNHSDLSESSNLRQ
ncbi:hypothetical protein AB3S75_024864 [Citrus x aurantiifolia]